MTAIDTNVLLDIATGLEPLCSRALKALDKVSSGLFIAPVVVSELAAHPHWNLDDVEPFIDAIGAQIGWNLSRETWLRAGEAYAAYARRRRRSGMPMQPRRLVADFIIGAHAETIGTLITRDAKFFRTAFPKLHVIEPERA